MPQTLTKANRDTTRAEQQTTDCDIESIYNSLHHELWSLFYAFCGDSERATDALQEAFLRLQQHDRSAIRNPRAWLLRVGRNWLRDVARARKRRPAERLQETPDSMETNDVAATRAECCELIRTGLDQLSERDRQTLVLRYGMQWSAQRIAETLESTATAIDMRLSRARTRLRDILIEQHPEIADFQS